MRTRAKWPDYVGPTIRLTLTVVRRPRANPPISAALRMTGFTGLRCGSIVNDCADPIECRTL